ncbi:MAG TPA: FkbM family methyltransferase [Stellaceae bacterium]|nr:FkbM family methyltransferase [Stellaceae bacterium]
MDVLSSGELVPDKAAAVLDITALAASPRVRPDGGYLPPMVSYAQNFEDVMLRRALQDLEHGYYVDIGAADPVSDSVTHHFYQNGWRGINVEPDPRYFNKLQEQRLEDTNLQCAIGAESGNIVFTITSPGGLSTGNAKWLSEINNLQDINTKRILVPVITLDNLLGLSCGCTIDFLKIDVEGMEEDILKEASFTLHRPRIIVIESTLVNNQTPSYQRWEPSLLKKEYEFAWFDGLNRFYVRKEDKWRLEFFRVPPCTFDNFFAVTIHTRVTEVTQRTTAEFERLREDLESRIGQLQADLVQRETDNQKRIGQLQADLVQREADNQKHESRIAQLQADFVQQKTDTQKLGDKLAQRENDYQRVQQRLIQMEISRRHLLEQLRLEESENQELNSRLICRDNDFQEAEKNAEQLESYCRELEEGLGQREKEIGLITADRDRITVERDRAAAQNLLWFEAAIPNDGKRLRSRQQYPLQTLLYRSRLWSWLAVGLRRRRRILMEAAKRARDQQSWALAARYYRDVLDLVSDRPGLWVQFGHALKEAGNIVAAEKAYRISLGLDAQIADTHLQLGHVLKLQGRNAEAAEAYMHSLSLAPGSPEAIYELRALGSSPLAAEYTGGVLRSAAA